MSTKSLALRKLQGLAPQRPSATTGATTTRQTPRSAVATPCDTGEFVVRGPVELWWLDEINDAAAVLTVHSEALGRDVLFVPDAWQRPAGEERQAFRVAELKRLASLRPSIAALRAIADAAHVFEGEVVAVSERPASVPEPSGPPALPLHSTEEP